ncbi:MAG: bifunctional 5,10-methylenetetrahydrofolate dehydrogenase/5,10-methenyltetrahydrofolate cyclohydrolase [Phycisphaerales bacterium]|nr:bifunctional 5,10-methylenetetrahydrofolate dehydrogenase/5,10-methenyltetrahydrofolate cyclohydrolase [Phycisphaerales bacterium]
MTPTILDGAAYAAEIRQDVAQQVRALRAGGRDVCLAAVLVGSDPAGRQYAGSQARQCEQVGISYRLVERPADISQDALLAILDELNADPTVTGVMLHMPLPAHIDAAIAQWRIDPYKDVEGVNPANIGLLFYGEPIIAPCTALAVNELIRRSGFVAEGRNAVVVGQSRIVGKPITMFLLAQNATVTACHKLTRDLPAHTNQADLLVVGVGIPRFINAEHVRRGAVVIDVGINSVVERGPDGVEQRRTVGDVYFERVAPLCAAITPVPGGVGPLTVAMLLRNTVEAARKQGSMAR